MSTVGFTSPTPADGATLTLGQPYTFRIRFIIDNAEAAADQVEPGVNAGAATREPDESQPINDSGDVGPQWADWTITPTAAGTLSVSVVTGGTVEVDAGSGAGSRTFTVQAAAVPPSNPAAPMCCCTN